MRSTVGISAVHGGEDVNVDGLKHRSGGWLMRACCVIVALSLIILAAGVVADEDDYIIHHRDAPEADSYNDRAGNISSDYDHDGTPNFIDPFDDDQLIDMGDRDFDGDGTPNYIDPYDDDWLEP